MNGKNIIVWIILIVVILLKFLFNLNNFSLQDIAELICLCTFLILYTTAMLASDIEKWVRNK